MAGAAVGLLHEAVIAFVLRPVARDDLVAVEALPGLRRPVEAHVAVLALRLELGVTLDDLSGHDRGLNSLRGRARRREPAQQDAQAGDAASWHGGTQYMCTAMTWTTALKASMTTNGTCSTCQRENRRS